MAIPVKYNNSDDDTSEICPEMLIETNVINEENEVPSELCPEMLIESKNKLNSKK